MDKIIQNLSEIEKGAALIQSRTVEEKKRIDAEIRKKTEAFEKELLSQTEQNINAEKKQIDKEAEFQREKATQEADQLIEQMEAFYEKNHKELVKQLFDEMTGA